MRFTDLAQETFSALDSNRGRSLLTVLGWCVFPFLLPDAVKMALALLLSKKIKLPNK